MLIVTPVLLVTSPVERREKMALGSGMSILRLLRNVPVLCLVPLLTLAGCQTPPGKTGAAPPPVSPVAEPVKPEPPAVVDATPAATQPEPPRVGFLAPLSGARAATGRSLLDAAQLALFETAGPDLELLVHDTRGTPEGAQRAARQAIADGAQIILGPVFGTSAETVRPVAAAAGVSVISFSNDRTIAGDGLYVLGILPEQQVSRVVRVAAKSGHTSLGIIAPDSDFGQMVADAARRTAQQVGMSVSRVVLHAPDEPDLAQLVRDFADYDRRKQALADQRSLLRARDDPISRQALQRLSTQETFGPPPFDVVLLPTGGRQLRTLASLLAYYDVDPSRVRFLGTSLWGQTEGVATEPSLRGGWYAAAAPEHRGRFRQRYARLFETQPAEIASQGYDAMLLAVALTYGDEGADYSAGALTDPNGFAGVDGIFRLLPDGTNQRGLAVMEVGDRTVTVLEPAPQSFDQGQS